MSHASLSSLCTFMNGGTPSKKRPDFFNGDIPWISSADIVDGVVTEPRSRISKDAIEASATNLVPKGTVLLVTRTGVGKVAIAPFDLCFSQDITAIIPKQAEKLIPGYLAYFLQSCEPTLKAQQRGATIQGITRDTLTGLNVPLRNLDQQRKIVEKLDRTRELKRLRECSIADLNNYLQALFIEMFGQQNPDSKHWPVVKIEDLASKLPNSLRTGPFGSDLKHSEFEDSGVAVLGIDNVVKNEFRWNERRFISEVKYQSLKRYTVRPGDVLITIMGTVGRSCVVPNDIPLAINTKHLAAITLDTKKALPEFISKAFLIHPDITAQLKRSEKGAIMAGLNLGIIKNLALNLPPLRLQQKFEESVESITALRKKYRNSATQMEQLFASLLAESFS